MIWVELVNLQKAVELHFLPLCAALEITVVDLHTIMSLMQTDIQRAGELARSVGREPTSFTPVLDRLEAAGFIKRTSNRKDRRSTYIQLTEKARSRDDLHRAFIQVNRIWTEEAHSRFCKEDDGG